MNNSQTDTLNLQDLLGLPIGISTLEEIRNKYSPYIDKTHHIARMVKGKYYFLSRPRRFGKSLFIDTLKQAFLGRKDLFKGLYLENHWDWSKKYPVIHFDFGSSSGYNSELTLLDIIWQTLQNSANLYEVELNTKIQHGIAFQQLIHDIFAKYQTQIVILIDEYDKPITDSIENTDQAKVMREILKALYSVIKTNGAYLKFVMLTGVSKFSQVSIFSGLNNLEDISIDEDYADICGYTQEELENSFSQYLIHGNVDREKLKHWYNGYNFGGSEAQKVYNPFDILLFFKKKYQYRNYWFKTGTPTFLIKLMQEKQYFMPDLESIVVCEESLESFDIENISIITLLFQSGYLTIKEVVYQGQSLAYRLSYPNFEVKLSLNKSLAYLSVPEKTKTKTINQSLNALEDNDFSALKNLITSHFARIPHHWYTNNDITEYEGFYASIIYSYFAALGHNLIAEDATNKGRIDLTMIMPNKILIIEFKLSKSATAQEAIEQIKSRKYAEKYQSANIPIYLLGIIFDTEERNVSEIASELLGYTEISSELIKDTSILV